MTKQGTPARGEGLQFRDCRRLHGIGRIVAHPRFEQVAEDVQGVRAARLGPQKLDELFGDCRTRRVDVQIGYEKDRHVPRCRAIKELERALSVR